MKNIIIIASIFLFSTHIFATDFNEKQKAIIYNEAIKVLKSYQELNNLMADAVVDIEEVNKTSQKLIDLFVNRKAIVYNDLDPAHKLSEVYELETYISNLLLWYPDGMKITLNFNDLKAGNIIEHGNEIFTVDLMTNKKNDGNYLNRQKNELTEELLYRIAFFQKGNTFENFKIAGVRSSKSASATSDSKMIAEVKSVTFSDKDLQLIKDQTKSLLNDYINFLNLLADPKETAEDKGFYKVSFLGLFKDTVLNVANDIEPDPQQRWISVTEYQENLIKSYPDGIKNLGMNIDSAEYGKIIPEGDEKYYINGYIDKFFSGKYQDKTVFRDNSKYDFKVSFERDENTFKNFKLASIDKFGVNLYDQSKAGVTQELPQQAVTSLKRNGLYVGSAFSAGKTLYSNPNLTDNPELGWKIENKSALSIEAQATYYFHNQMGLTGGIGYSHYSANSSLYGKYQSTVPIYDSNNTEGFNTVSSSYDSLLNYNYLSIPLKLVFHSNKNTETWGIYGELGIVTSILIGANYQINGDYSTWDYYPEFYYNWQEDPNIVGDEWVSETFIDDDRTQIDEQGKIDAKAVHLALTTSFGVTYPLDYFTTVYIGPEIVWGLNSIYKDANYTDAFGTSNPAEKVGLSRVGVKFGISYKF